MCRLLISSRILGLGSKDEHCVCGELCSRNMEEVTKFFYNPSDPVNNCRESERST